MARGRESQGTYVDLSTGLNLCEEYGFNSLKSILRQTLEEHQRDLSQPAATAPKPDIRNRRQNTTSRDNRVDNMRPSCNHCKKKHRKCDRGDICEFCRISGLGNQPILTFLGESANVFRLYIH